ncbi:hypothetical protein PV08_07106 [Exophiala spinifera]|uniref:Srp40 C-terminal domain-containing protein n=1 Tax=Exophiala spinifera TaxID=91928 RepID=A0A0D2BSR6_9EURO|nr:uncharacterized protein PV08_07106 [Exophiala spinifera]KIW14324.1 hypothetical protein PV08_07106 [Exophiala spinifera]
MPVKKKEATTGNAVPRAEVLGVVGHYLTEFGLASTNKAFQKELKRLQESAGWPVPAQDEKIGDLVAVLEQGFLSVTGDLATKNSTSSEDSEADSGSSESSGSTSSSDSSVDSGSDSDSEVDISSDSDADISNDSDDDSDSSETSSSTDSSSSNIPKKTASAKKKNGKNLKLSASTSASSSSSSESSIESDEDEVATQPKSAVSSLKPKSSVESVKPASTKTLKRKAEASSSSGSSSSSDSDSSEEDEPPVKRAKVVPASTATQTSSSESSSESDSDSSDDEAAGEAGNGAKLGPEHDEKSDSSNTVMGDNMVAASRPVFEKTPKKHVGARPTPLAQLSAQATGDSYLSNAYQSYDYADRAYKDLSVTRGKGFTKEKNKKKRGSYRGGAIDISGGKAFKFDD